LLSIPLSNAQQRKVNAHIKNDSIQTDTIKQEIDSIRIEQNSINKNCKKNIKELLKLIEEEEKRKKEEE